MAYKDRSTAIKYNNEYNKQAYDRINLTVPKGKKESIQTAAQANGESVNAFINRLIDTELERIEQGEGISHISRRTDDKK
ncbi:MAG: hypothetical protein IJZ33_01795 [Clostridia bacterium]|nr:hypothetical protein [Clostridia bacterium]